MVFKSLTVRIGADTASLTAGLNKARASVKEFGSSITEVGRNLSVSITAPLVLLGRELAHVSGDFQAAMFRVQALSQSNVVEMQRLEAAARLMGATTKFTATDAADALGIMAMMGYNAEKQLVSLPRVLELAAASGLEMAQATSVVDNVMAGLRLHIEDLAHVNDVLVGTFTRTNTTLEDLGVAMRYVGPIAASAKVPVEQLSAALGLLGNAGIQGSMAGTSVRGALSRLLAPTDQIRDAMQAAGIEVRRLSDGSFDLIGLIDQLSSHAGDAGLMMTIFGQRAGPAFAALAGMGRDAIEQLTTILEAQEGVAGRVADAYNQGLNGALYSLQSAFEAVQLSIGKSGVTDSLERFARSLATLLRNISAINPQMLFMAAKLALIAAAIGPVLLMLGGLVKMILTVATAGVAFRTLSLAFAGAAVSAVSLTTAIGSAVTVMGGLLGAMAAVVVAAAGWIIWRQLKAEIDGAGEAMRRNQSAIDAIAEANQRLSYETGQAAQATRELRNEQLQNMRVDAARALAALNRAEGRTYGDNGPSMTRAAPGHASDVEIIRLRADYARIRDELAQVAAASRDVDNLPQRQAAWLEARHNRDAARARGISFQEWAAANPELARTLRDTSAAPPIHGGIVSDPLDTIDLQNLPDGGAAPLPSVVRGHTLEALQRINELAPETTRELERLQEIEDEYLASVERGESVTRAEVEAWVDQRRAIQDVIDARTEYGDVTAETERAAAAQEMLTAAAQRGANEYRITALAIQIMGQNAHLTAEQAMELARAQDRVDEANRQTSESMQRMSQFAQNVGQAFASAFERAIFAGDSLGDVLKSLVKDLVVLIARLLIIEPLARSITSAIQGGGKGGSSGFNIGGFFSSLFSGFFAEGGYVGPGKWGIVGEHGPEPVYGGATGMTVFPNGSGGGGYTDARVYNFQGTGAEIAEMRRAISEIDRSVESRAFATMAEQRRRRRF